MPSGALSDGKLYQILQLGVCLQEVLTPQASIPDKVSRIVERAKIEALSDNSLNVVVYDN